MFRCFGGIRLSLFLLTGLAMMPTQGQEKHDQSQQTEQENFKIKVDVDLVTTDVTVLGNPVSELRGEDFIIYDNNVAQPVTHFSLDQYPLAVAILVDASLSIEPYLPVLQIAAASALRRLKPEDQVMLYSFSQNTYRLNDLTEDRYVIAEKIGKIKVALGTNIYGTINDAANFLKKHAPNRRRAIILISDNCHRMGTSSADKNRVELLETSTILYSIRTPSIDFTPERFKHDKLIQQLARDTGGQVLDVERPSAVQEVLEKAIANLRMQYTLGFNPPAPGEKGSFHRLAVKLASEDRCPGCRLLARSGYYAGVTPPLPPPDKPRKEPRHSLEKTNELLIQRSMMNAGSLDTDLSDIRFKVTTARQMDSKGQPQVKVNLQITIPGIVFKPVEDKHLCKLRVAVFYANRKGKLLGSDWKTIENQLPQDAYGRVLTTGISFSTLIPVKTDQQMLRIVVYDEGSDKMGSKLVRLQ
jgi:Ca-activated chloride channel homolog